MKRDATRITAFVNTVWEYYRSQRRDMPWREDTSPYSVIVSEIMLQQTQVDRVRTKFASWMKRFPDWKSLAQASTKDVLSEWTGLGYNRRALYVKRIAEAVVADKRYDFLKNGKVAPKEIHELLRTLPGIGPNTAGAVMAYSFNLPSPFIETNIRSVFIHHFFPEIEKREGRKACKKISDVEIIPFIEAALADRRNQKNPREWYWALMDYGSDLKRRLSNPSRRSAHLVKQSKFEGSNRQLRSQILRFIMQEKTDRKTITKQFKGHEPEKIEKNLTDLIKEDFIRNTGTTYMVN
jgi:A/G-specific adenine glycosylase